MWKHYQYTLPGQRHLKNNENCQDRASYMTDGFSHVMVLCDGAGSQSHSEEGARIMAASIAGMLIKNYTRFFETIPEIVRNEMIILIRQVLADLSEEFNLPVTAFASTVMVVYVDDRGRYMAFHLGDGVICKKSKEKLEIISYPANRITDSFTFLSSDPDVYAHLKFMRGTDKDTQGFCLATDGIKNSLLHENIEDLFNHPAETGRWLSFQKPEDDASIAFLINE